MVTRQSPMGTVFRGLAVLALILVMAPVARADGAITPATLDPPFELAASELAGATGLFKEISNMPPQQVVVIGLAAAGSAYLASMYLGSGIYTMVAAVMAAAIANHYYEESHKSFGRF